MTDKKTIKFIRQAQKRLEGVEPDQSLVLADPDTQNTFAILQPILGFNANVAAFNQLGEEVMELADRLGKAFRTIDELKGDKDGPQMPPAFTDLFAAENYEDDKVSSSFGAGPLWNPEAGDQKTHEAPAGSILDEHGNKIVGKVLITDQEFEEFLSLRKKRETDHKQLYLQECQLKKLRKENLKLAEKRDDWAAKYADVIESQQVSGYA